MNNIRFGEFKLDIKDDNIPLKDRIYEYLRKGHVSFAEITQTFGRGNQAYGYLDKNIGFWFCLNKQTCDCLIELHDEKKIEFFETSMLVYLIDGSIPQVPIATSSNRKYKEMHWLPVVINRM